MLCPVSCSSNFEHGRPCWWKGVNRKEETRLAFLGALQCEPPALIRVFISPESLSWFLHLDAGISRCWFLFVVKFLWRLRSTETGLNDGRKYSGEWTERSGFTDQYQRKKKVGETENNNDKKKSATKTMKRANSRRRLLFGNSGAKLG